MQLRSQRKRSCTVDTSQSLKIRMAGLHPQSSPKTSLKESSSSSKWQKLLYIKQNFPDNHVDTASFLKLMKRNSNVRPLKYWKVVGESGRVTQQISVIFIFLALYIHLNEMDSENASAHFLFYSMWGSLGSFSMYLLYTLLPGSSSSHKPYSQIGSTLLSSLIFTGGNQFISLLSGVLIR